MKYFETFNVNENVKLDHEGRPYWEKAFQENSVLQYMSWNYAFLGETFEIRQVAKNDPYEWHWHDYTGSAPTLGDARSAARNAVRSAVIRKARELFNLVCKKESTQ